MGSSEFFFIDLFIIPQSRRTGYHTSKSTYRPTSNRDSTNFDDRSRMLAYRFVPFVTDIQAATPDSFRLN
jgi:hypothetical protein